MEGLLPVIPTPQDQKGRSSFRSQGRASLLSALKPGGAERRPSGQPPTVHELREANQRLRQQAKAERNYFSQEVQHLKNKLNHYKTRAESLQASVHATANQLAGTLEEKSTLIEQQKDLDKQTAVLREQVQFQAQRNTEDQERIRYLKDCLTTLHTQVQDRFHDVRQEQVRLARSLAEQKQAEARVEAAKRAKAVAEQRQKQQQDDVATMKQGDPQDVGQEQPPTQLASGPGWVDGQQVVLQEAYNEIAALREQTRSCVRERQVLESMQTQSPLCNEVLEWEEKVAALRQRLADRGLAEREELEEPPPNQQAFPTELRQASQLLRDLLRPRRHRSKLGKQFDRAKRRLHKQAVEEFKKEVAHQVTQVGMALTSEPFGPLEALCRAVAQGQVAPFRWQLARLRAESTQLKLKDARSKATCSAVRRSYQRRLEEQQAEVAAREQQLESQAAALDLEIEVCKQELEEKSGSGSSLQVIEAYFSAQLSWLRLQLEQDQEDLKFIEDAQADGDLQEAQEQTFEQLEDMLARKRVVRQQRVQQVHSALVNIEKDIRLEERRQKALDPGYQPLQVRWTASGDTADADVQTDSTGFIFSKELHCARRQLTDFAAEISVSVMSDDHILVRVTPDGTGGMPLYSYLELQHINLPDSQKEKLGYAGEEDEGEVRRLHASPELAMALVDLVEVRQVKEAWHVALRDQNHFSSQNMGIQHCLEADCLYNDQEVLRTVLRFDAHPQPFVCSAIQCRKTKYGMSFLHIRIYQPLAKWERFSTCNLRDFCRTMQQPSVQQLGKVLRTHRPDAQDAQTIQDFRAYVEEAFLEELQALPRDLPSDAPPSRFFPTQVLWGEVKEGEKRYMLEEQCLPRKKDRRRTHADDEHASPRGKAGEGVFVDLALELGPDGYVDVKTQFSIFALAVSQETPKKKKKALGNKLAGALGALSGLGR